MSTSPFDVLPPADEALVRAHAAELLEIAARYRITNLRFASTGRLVGHVDDIADVWDIGAFECAVIEILHADVMLIGDRVLSNPGVSQDLVDAEPI